MPLPVLRTSEFSRLRDFLTA